MKNWLFIFFVFGLSIHVFSQSGLYYRTKLPGGSGEWATASVWEVSSTNANPWSTATVAPNSTSQSITIRNGSTVTISSTTGSISADQLSVDGTLTISTGGSLTVLDGTGTDLTSSSVINLSGGTLLLNGFCSTTGTLSISSGTLTVAGTLSNSGTISGSTAAITTFQSTARYRKLNTTDFVPLATWSSGSVFEVGGFTGTVTLVSTNWTQAFSNVEINLTNLTNSTRVVNFNSNFFKRGDQPHEPYQ
jgi:hypothetical protein